MPGLWAEPRELSRSAGGDTKLSVSDYADMPKPRGQLSVVSTPTEHTALFSFQVCEKLKTGEGLIPFSLSDLENSNFWIGTTQIHVIQGAVAGSRSRCTKIVAGFVVGHQFTNNNTEIYY